MALASLIIAVISLAAATVSVLYTRRQAVAGERVAEIEQGRRHDDLTPELDVECTLARDGIVQLTLELTGPAGVDRLDEVRVRVRDDRPGRKPSPALGLTDEQFAQAIWGPCRLNPDAENTDPIGREHGPFKLLRNEPYPLHLEPSPAPSWWIDLEAWRRQVNKQPVRLEITCRRQDDPKPWVVLREITPVNPLALRPAVPS